jgi:hypothetical protein
MENTRLSLADFKAKADKVQTSEILDKVQGGANDNCHVEPDRIDRLGNTLRRIFQWNP